MHALCLMLLHHRHRNLPRCECFKSTISNRRIIKKTDIYGQAALHVLKGIRSIIGGGASHHSKHWRCWDFTVLPRLVPGTMLSFEKEDYMREFSVAVPLASKKTFPQKATIMARTAQQSITVRFDDDSKNSWYSLEEA